MATLTPSRLFEVTLAPSQHDVDAAFAALTDGLTIVEERVVPKKNRITVMLDLPHLAKYGRTPTRELTYGCNFKVAVGDLVMCPPTPLHHQWTTGMVTALTHNGYKGRVKFVKKTKAEISSEAGTSHTPPESE